MDGGFVRYQPQKKNTSNNQQKNRVLNLSQMMVYAEVILLEDIVFGPPGILEFPAAHKEGKST